MALTSPCGVTCVGRFLEFERKAAGAAAFMTAPTIDVPLNKQPGEHWKTTVKLKKLRESAAAQLARVVGYPERAVAAFFGIAAWPSAD